MKLDEVLKINKGTDGNNRKTIVFDKSDYARPTDNHVDRIGIEIEFYSGVYSTYSSFENSDEYKELRKKYRWTKSQENVFYNGREQIEIQSPPLSISELKDHIRAIDKLFKSIDAHFNKFCGVHFHVSFKNMLTIADSYNIVNNTDVKGIRTLVEPYRIKSGGTASAKKLINLKRAMIDSFNDSIKNDRVEFYRTYISSMIYDDTRRILRSSKNKENTGVVSRLVGLNVGSPKYSAINFNTAYDTVEFRFPDISNIPASDAGKIILRWVNYIYKLCNEAIDSEYVVVNRKKIHKDNADALTINMINDLKKNSMLLEISHYAITNNDVDLFKDLMEAILISNGQVWWHGSMNRAAIDLSNAITFSQATLKSMCDQCISLFKENKNFFMSICYDSWRKFDRVLAIANGSNYTINNLIEVIILFFHNKYRPAKKYKNISLFLGGKPMSDTATRNMKKKFGSEFTGMHKYIPIKQKIRFLIKNIEEIEQMIGRREI